MLRAGWRTGTFLKHTIYTQASPVLVREDGHTHAYHHQQQHTAAATASSTRPAFPPSAAAKARAQADAQEEAASLKEGEGQGLALAPPPKAGEVSLVVMKWGLVPAWHKKGEKPDFFRAFNARSETVAWRVLAVLGWGLGVWVSMKDEGWRRRSEEVHESNPSIHTTCAAFVQVASKPFFKRLVNSRRCVVVLDGCVRP
jgi:putative SOS response-associated peptidase YedK